MLETVLLIVIPMKMGIQIFFYFGFPLEFPPEAGRPVVA
jgi:hypothetical protein